MNFSLDANTFSRNKSTYFAAIHFPSILGNCPTYLLLK